MSLISPSVLGYRKVDSRWWLAFGFCFLFAVMACAELWEFFNEMSDGIVVGYFAFKVSFLSIGLRIGWFGFTVVPLCIIMSGVRSDHASLRRSYSSNHFTYFAMVCGRLFLQWMELWIRYSAEAIIVFLTGAKILERADYLLSEEVDSDVDYGWLTPWWLTH